MALDIALLEDEQTQAQTVKFWLSSEGHQCQIFTTGQSLLQTLKEKPFDLLLIDWELPDIKGPEVMRIIRQDMHIDTPIIFETARDSEQDIVAALNAGADDYLIKPFSSAVFLARVNANTRRQQPGRKLPDQVEFSPYIFNLNNQQVSLHDRVIDLSGKEFELSYYLFSHEGKLLDRKEILSRVWQQQADLNTRTVDTHISTLRRKLDLAEQNGWRLRSIYGHGYRLERMAN